MKQMFRPVNFTSLLLVLPLMLLLAAGCKKKKEGTEPAPPPPVQTDPPGAPPRSIQEDWFEHRQGVSRVYYDSVLTVYYDNEVPTSITWPNTFINQVWQYTRKTYGYAFGPDARLYAVFSCRQIQRWPPGLLLRCPPWLPQHN